MKILIIEDEDYKQKDLSEALAEILPEGNIVIANTFRGARQVLANEKFDLCLLDMTLPTFSRQTWAGAPESSALAGRRLINFIEKTKVAKRVVVFTQYSTFSEYTEEMTYLDLIQIVARECPKVFAGSIQYLVGNLKWKNELAEIVKKIKDEDFTS